MARYHVRADGSMGVCTAKEGNCPFGGEEGTRHFTSKAEAQAYSESVVRPSASGTGGLKRSGSSSGDGSEPPSSKTIPGPLDDGYDLTARWMGKNLNQALTEYEADKRFADSIDNERFRLIVRDATKDVEIWEDGDAGTPGQCMDLEIDGRLAAALHKDPAMVKEYAIRYDDDVDRNGLMTRLDEIAENSGEETGRRARALQADLAWRRDGQPYYPEWEKTHRDEAFFDGSPAWDMKPLGGGLDGLTDEELKDELEERDHAVGAMMEDLRDQMDYISHDLPLKATSSKEFDQAVTDMDAVLEEIDGHLKDVDEIDNPSYWDAEPDGLKRQYGKRLQAVRALYNEALDYDNVAFEAKREWDMENDPYYD